MSRFDGLISLLKHFVSVGPPGCGLTVSQEGKMIFEHYEGLADRENNRPMDKNTVYRVFSCTKPITIAAAMKLFERGKFLLDDSVETYLPYFANLKYYHYEGSNTTQVLPCKHLLTIKHLMTMTSGIPYGGENNLTQRDILQFADSFPKENLDLQELARRLSEVPLAFEPGTHYMYGFGMDLLGAVVEAIADKSFGEFLQDEIFTPLGMQNTAFTFKNDQMRQNLAALYDVQDDGSLKRNDGLDCRHEPGVRFESGGGGLLSTIGDMSRFSSMMAMGGTLDGVRILSPRTVNLIRMDHLKGQAKADFIEVTERTWPNMVGYSFGLCCRTLVNPADAGSPSSLGEFAWSGAAGTWSLIDPDLRLSAQYAQQLFPSERNMQAYCHPRLRNAIYASVF